MLGYSRSNKTDFSGHSEDPVSSLLTIPLHPTSDHRADMIHYIIHAPTQLQLSNMNIGEPYNGMYEGLVKIFCDHDTGAFSKKNV